MNFIRTFGILCMALLPCAAMAQRQQQRLGRGVVAVQNGSAVTVTWRRLAQEPEQATYNVYVNGVKKNTAPLTNTNWKTTTSVVPVNSDVTVTMVANGVESEPSKAFRMKSRDCRSMFMDINFEQGGSPLRSSDFNTSYVWPIDLNGDGEMDYVVNRASNTNGLDCYVEAYLSSGEHLWTVKLGPNELSCSGQDDQITVADMDCDGLGEVVIQSSDGTQFWNPDTKTFGLYVGGKTTGDTDGDGIINYETQSTRNAPRYISVIDGMTGREKAYIEQSYNQHYNRTNRASLMGDEYNKHVGHMGVFYHDGVHPAVVMEWHIRGTGGDHHYYNLGVAYDFSSGKAGEFKELFNAPTGGATFHQIRIGDVDGDGKDEMIEGSYTMNNTGGTLFNTGIAHGDRFRSSDIDPERPGLETFAVLQNAGDMLGQVLYDAGTGEFIKKWYLSAVGDIGRGECMDIDKNHLGWEMWSVMNGSVYDAQGNLIPEYGNQYPCEGIWWDEEPDREVVQTSDSHYNVYVQDFFKGRLIEIAKLSNWRYVTVYAKRAAFWGDIIGDWREELILLHKENGVTVGISGFTTDYTTDVNNIYCLLEDPHYRGDCSTKGYYQSPNPGFYLGYDMPRPQLPPCMVTDLIYAPNATTWAGSSFTNFERNGTAAYADGKSVMFDLTSGSNVALSSEVRPSAVYAMPVKGQTISLSGTGALAGTMDLWKSQQGRFTINVPMNFSGTTYISEGVLEVNNTIQGNVELRARGTLAGNATVAGNLQLEGALNYEGGRLMPGTASQPLGTITLQKGLNINARLFAEMDIRNADATADLIAVNGDITIADGGSLVFTIVPDVATPQPARYRLVSYTGTFTGAADRISVRGLQGLSYSIVNEENALWLVINEQRSATDNVHWTGAESGTWDYQSDNFELNGNATEFVADDGIVFDDAAVTTNIQVNELMPVRSVTFENNTKDFTIGGTGGFTGNANLVKNGNGRVTLNTANSNYTGKTIINSGTLVVNELADGGLPSSIGAASSSADNWQIGKATLIVSNANTATNRGLTLNDTATIQITSGVTALKGIIQGKGRLVKKGSGQLNITYAGNNTWASTELAAGTLAMGVWNTTFGTATSPIDVTGTSTITIFNNNSTGAIPSLRNAINVEQGKTLTINGGQRCNVQGSFSGSGTVKINFPYVRGDFSTTLTNFEGTLNPTSGQFRMTTGMNLRNGTFMPGGGVYAVGVQSQSANEVGLTHYVGALSATASDAQLANGTWNVGYLGTNTTFAGIINANATLNKYGEGVLSLSGQSGGRINVNEGTVSLENSNVTTSALVTAANGGTVLGTGKTASVTVQNGGIVSGGKAASTSIGTLSITGNLIVQSGGTIRVRGRSTRTVDALKVDGRITLTSPTFLLERVSGDWQPDTDYKIFTGTAPITLTGTPTFLPAVPLEGYLWDYSQLVSDGILRIVPDPTGINGVNADGSDKEIYDLNGRSVGTPATHGIYIINGKKVLQ